MQQKIIAYKLVNISRHTGLTEEAASKILKDGWQPYGSPLLMPSNDVKQAFVKFDEPTNEPLAVRRG